MLRQLRRTTWTQHSQLGQEATNWPSREGKMDGFDLKMDKLPDPRDKTG